MSDVRQKMDKIWTEGGFDGAINYLDKQYPGIHLPDGVNQSDWREELIRNDAKRVSAEVQSVLDYFKGLGPDKAEHSVKAMLRYAIEGDEATYVPDASFRNFLMSRFGDQLKGNRSLLDLGCGNVGQYLNEWDSHYDLEKGFSKGIDLSPSFALRGRGNNISVGAIDAPLKALKGQIHLPLHNDGADLVVSSLTLDRLGNPKQAIGNMHALTGHGGKVVLGSLFPIVPEDDEPGIAHKIIYTPPENRVTSIGNLDGDLKQLRQYIEDSYGVLVTVDNYQYVVHSSGGMQVYDNYRILSWDRNDK